MTTERALEFGVPTTEQAADKASPPGDRTPQELNAVATRDSLVVAAGYDDSDNVRRPLLLSSEDGGVSWVRRTPDRESKERSSTFEQVLDLAAGPSGFVAIGDSADGPVVWHSADGREWSRLPDDRRTFPAGDSVSQITATSTGFAVIGTTSNGYAGQWNQLIYWQSKDGKAWTRTPGPSIGLKTGLVGEFSAGGIAAQGAALVISANLETEQDGEQQHLVRYWYSADGGRTFRASQLAGDVAEAIDAYSNVLISDGGKFYALVKGSGFDDDTWDGVVLEGGTSGSTLRQVAAPWLLGSAFEDSPAALVRAGEERVAASNTSAGSDDVVVAAGGTWTELRDRTDVTTQRIPGSQYVHDAATVGDAAVLVGSSDRSGTNEPMIWRYDDRKVTSVALPTEASAGTPSTLAYSLHRSGEQLVAAGLIGGSPAAWTRTDERWQAEILPGSRANVTPSVTAAISAPDGRIVMVGAKTFPIGQRAAVWIRGTDGRWTDADAPVFGVQAKVQYGGPSPSAVAVGPKKWVVVGERYDGDGHQDAWAVYSTDGKTWSEIRGDRELPPDKTTDTRRQRWRNLRAPGTATSTMTAVTSHGQGFVAAGSISDDSGRPAIWLSPDGVSWPTLVRPALPKGVSTASVAEFGHIGNTLVAVADVTRFAGDPEGGWTSFTSTDGGRSWQTGAVAEPARAYGGSLVAVPGGLVALGNTGRLGGLDAAAWFSRDGRTWRALDLPDEHTKGPGRQGFVSGVVQDDKLLALGFDIPPTGGGSHVIELPLPK